MGDLTAIWGVLIGINIALAGTLVIITLLGVNLQRQLKRIADALEKKIGE